MAQLRTVTRANPLSTFRQTAPEAGQMFGLMAEAMQSAYEVLEPIAIEQESQKGDALGREIARSQIGRAAEPYVAPPVGALPSTQGPIPFAQAEPPVGEVSVDGSALAHSDITVTPLDPIGARPVDQLTRIVEGALDGTRDGVLPRLEDQSPSGAPRLPDGTAPMQPVAPVSDPGGVVAGSGGTRTLVGSEGADALHRVVSAGAGWTEVALADGTTQRREGTRAWRNNNPGNIEYGPFARAHGAVGTDGRFAVFPSYEAGRAAKGALLFESASYRDRTIAGAINRYAPPVENDTNAYASTVAAAVGVPLTTRISSLSPEQRDSMLDAMEKVEGFRPGTVNGAQAPAPAPGAAPINVPLTGRTSGGGPATPATPPLTYVREADGRLTGRLYGPSSSPILRAHDAAAQVAYNAEMMTTGLSDLISLSSQFENDPGGYAEAARARVEEIAQGAPAQFRRELRGRLQQEADRRTLGVLEDQQRDIRQRSANSNQALISRYSQDYADALATGDQGAIDGARALLDEQLVVRESLPGLAWTPEQSDNVLLDAQEAAIRQREVAGRERANADKARLRTIIGAAEAGQYAADEAMLADPALRLAHPELWEEAMAKVVFRDQMPSFRSLPPDQQAEIVTAMEGDPVENPWDLDLSKAARSIADGTRKMWDSDPIAAAEAILGDPPPPLPDFTTGDEGKILAALEDRRAYAEGLAAQGYTDVPAYLSANEADALGKALGGDTPPEAQMLLTGALARGFGDAAVQVFDEIEAPAEVRFAGKMLATGVNPTVALEILTGAQMLREGTSEAPKDFVWREAFASDVGEAFAGLPSASRIGAQAEVMKAARSIYAARSGGAALEDDAQSAMVTGAIQAALGQVQDRRGRLTGGVQAVNGHQVLLPPGVGADEVDVALRSALGFDPAVSGPLNHGRMARTWLFGDDAEAAPSLFGDDGVPMIGKVPLREAGVRPGQVALIPMGGSRYRMEIRLPGSVSDVRDASGGVFQFDLSALLERAR